MDRDSDEAGWAELRKHHSGKMDPKLKAELEGVIERVRLKMIQEVDDLLGPKAPNSDSTQEFMGRLRKAVNLYDMGQVSECGFMRWLRENLQHVK